jgi:CheY-like chemotaxis protein
MYNSDMSSFSGDNKHLGDNSPLHQSKQGLRQLQQQHEQVVKFSPFTKRILIVDDDPDITFTFKKAFEAANRINGGNNKILFHVNTYNDPIHALSEFKPDFYDLMLVDINMPKMNGFDFCAKILGLDINPRICFMSSAFINQEALKEQYPSLSIGCFIEKPITMENLIRKAKSELE